MSDENLSTSDASVIEASLTDPAAFAVLFDRHAAVIWRYARRREPALADEVLSETFVRAFAGRTRYDLTQSDARPWLRGIATNVLRGHRRGDERRRRAYALAGERERTDGDLELVEARGRSGARAGRCRGAGSLGTHRSRDVVALRVD
jgi:DNA-directed RNA polymerase specialized sigma24 family protein